MPKPIDLTGQKFGRLTVMEEAPRTGRRRRWKCRCDCGKEIVTLGESLRAAATVSCGCYNNTKAVTHGQRKTKLYYVWRSMKTRCSNPKRPYYNRYGGRGIKVCDEWLDSEKFFKWALENGYQDGLQIDRIDNDGDYTPENCRWVTPTENSNNHAKNVKLTWNGETHSLSEWARITGIPRSRLEGRYRAGKPPEEIFKQ